MVSEVVWTKNILRVPETKINRDRVRARVRENGDLPDIAAGKLQF